MINVNNITNVEFGGVDMSDYPKFCDAYIESADYNGRPATEAEIEDMMSDGSVFYDLLTRWLN